MKEENDLAEYGKVMTNFQNDITELVKLYQTMFNVPINILVRMSFSDEKPSIDPVSGLTIRNMEIWNNKQHTLMSK
jgi:uncharacterized protein YdhG (YjbR/CyaY superfamily)